MTHISTYNRLSGAAFMNVAIRSALDCLIIGGIFFYVNPSGGFTSVGIFLALFPLVAIISISGEVVYDLLKGYATEDYAVHRRTSEDISPAGWGETLWGRIASCAILLALITVPPLYWLLQAFSPEGKTLTGWVLGAVCLVVIAACCLTLRIVGDRIIDWYVGRLAMPQQEASKEASDRFMVFNYFLPWAVIAAIIAGLLSWGYFSPRSEHAPAYIDVAEMAFSCGGTAYIIALWIAYITQKQATIDIRAQLLRFEDDDTLDEGTMYFLIHAWSGCIIVAIFIISRFFSWASFTPLQVTLIDALVAALSAIVGALGGLLRARTSLLTQGLKK